jgi:hypothetical protein
MRITTGLATAVVPALLATTLAFAQDQQAKTFLTEAIEGNLAEVQMGQLAQKQATTLAVRSLWPDARTGTHRGQSEGASGRQRHANQTANSA